jgi:hypothetical protein
MLSRTFTDAILKMSRGRPILPYIIKLPRQYPQMETYMYSILEKVRNKVATMNYAIGSGNSYFLHFLGKSLNRAKSALQLEQGKAAPQVGSGPGTEE